MGYNIYSRMKKVHMFNVLIDDRKKNLSDANRVSFLYKINFILYTLLTMLAVVFLVFNFVGPLQIMKKIRLFQWIELSGKTLQGIRGRLY